MQLKQFKADIVSTFQKSDDVLIDILGKEGKEQFLCQPHSAKYIRLPQRPELREQVKSFILANDPSARVNPAFPHALKVDHTIGWAHHIRYYLGQYYMQTLASMLPPVILAPEPGEFILDMCAAPGSKTTMMADMMNNSGRLVANEWDRNRIQRLASNLDRMGVYNTAVSNKNGHVFGKLYPNTFDRILVDAPCSSIGAPEKWSNVKEWLTHRNIKHLVTAQIQLLQSAVHAVKPGGSIVYSTCTLNPLENEAVVSLALETFDLELLPVENTFGLTRETILQEWLGMTFQADLTNCLKISPLANQTEGFFVAHLRKKSVYPSDTVPEWRPFAPAEKKDIADLKSQYQMDESAMRNRAFHGNQEKLWMMSHEWAEGLIPFALKTGIKLAEKRFNRKWRFSQTGARLMGENVYQQRLQLNEDQWLEVLEKKRLKLIQPDGYYVLFWEDLPVTYGLMDKGTLKIKIGRPFRFEL
jgi:NOL1/NOP2/sun family putative RNA methylase